MTDFGHLVTDFLVTINDFSSSGCWSVELVFCARVDHLLYKLVDS